MDQKPTLQTPDGPMDAFLALPEGSAPAPALVVAQEAFGVNRHIQEVCRRLAREGYIALAPELFHRTGAGMELLYTNIEAVMPHLARLTNAGIEMDLQAALEYLRGLTRAMPRHVGVVGFCLGGFAAFLAACRTDVAAAVSFYGGGVVRDRPGIDLRPLLSETERITAPILLFFGADDASIPPEDIESIRSRLSATGKVHDIVVYPGAGHGFLCDARASFHAQAAADAWRRTCRWLQHTLRD